MYEDDQLVFKKGQWDNNSRDIRELNPTPAQFIREKAVLASFCIRPTAKGVEAYRPTSETDRSSCELL